MSVCMCMCVYVYVCSYWRSCGIPRRVRANNICWQTPALTAHAQTRRTPPQRRKHCVRMVSSDGAQQPTHRSTCVCVCICVECSHGGVSGRICAKGKFIDGNEAVAQRGSTGCGKRKRINTLDIYVAIYGSFVGGLYLLPSPTSSPSTPRVCLHDTRTTLICHGTCCANVDGAHAHRVAEYAVARVVAVCRCSFHHCRGPPGLWWSWSGPFVHWQRSIKSLCVYEWSGHESERRNAKRTEWNRARTHNSICAGWGGCVFVCARAREDFGGIAGSTIAGVRR